VHEALLIEPTETETKEALEAFANALIAIDKEIDENPEFVAASPHTTEVKRINDAYAARNLNTKFAE
jgi:glycine dehydrogenase subunit 2